MTEPRDAAAAQGPPGAAARVAGLLSERVAGALPDDASRAAARAALRDLAGIAPGGLSHLVEALALSPAEVDLLVLAGLPEEHEAVATLFRALHPRGEPRPTVGVAAMLFCGNAEERSWLREVLAHGALVRSGALHLAGEAPFFEKTMALADALWPALAGLDVWPEPVQRLEGATATHGLDAWLSSPRALRARAALASGEPRTVLLLADDEGTALARASALALAAGVPFVRTALRPGAPPGADRLISLHAVARGALPIVTVAAPDGQGAPLPLGALDAHPGPVLLCARDGIGAVRGARPVLALRAEGLSRAARRAMWSAALPDLAPDAALLAARYPIEPHVAAEVALDVRDTAQLEGRAPALADVVEAVRTRTAAALSTGASLVRPAVSWDDLVLPPDRLSQLREAIGRLLHQPRVIEEWGFLGARPGAHGVRALFVGPPGTGKTLSAEVMAGALGTDLLVVDISRVVSKWIGETEKNLAAVFDVAERARAVLFFDEADALFGKRTEVSDAHDRYANLETAYLLARLERFEGLVILASNFRQNIDAAFLRRLEFVIEFEEPDLAERERLWSRHVPPGAPLAPDVHLGELSALYPITGGLIRNAAAAAGFLAAGEGTAITRRHFIHAIRREYDKAGRAFPGAPPGMTNHQGGTMS